MLSVQRCQRVQRLSISVHRDDAHVACVAARLLCVFPSRNEKDVRSGAPGADRLLLEAADGEHRAVEAHLAARDHPVAVVDIVSELLGDVERECEPADGPPTWPRSMCTGTGSEIFVGVCSAQLVSTPMIERFLSWGSGAVFTSTVRTAPSRRTVSATLWPGRCLVIWRRRAGSDGVGCPSTAAIVSFALQLARRGPVRVHVGDHGPRRLDRDSVAELLQSDGCTDLLGLRHRPQLLALMLLVALAGRDDGRGGNERRALAETREQLLEQARLLHLDRDVVDPATVAVGALSLAP